jgi:hypothetical protein
MPILSHRCTRLTPRRRPSFAHCVGATLILVLTTAGVAPADDAESPGVELSAMVAPVVAFPIGSSREFFRAGYGAELAAAWTPSGWSGLGVGAGARLVTMPLRTQSAIRLASAYASPAYRLELGRRVSVAGTARIGGYWWAPREWDAHEANGGGLLTGIGAGVAFRVAGPLSVGLEASYDFYARLAHSARVHIGLSLDSRGLRPMRSGLEIESIELRPVFPVLYSYYDDNPVGSVTVRNSGDILVEDVRVRFLVERFMDNPTDVATSFDLAPGETITVDLHALFTEEMLRVTEGTHVSARVDADGESGGAPVAAELSATLRLHNRNALSWDDDRKIASFVTAKDPEVLAFARNVVTWMQDTRNPAVDENLQKALVLYEAVRAYGVRYEIDPTTPFAELSTDESAIDFLQFPRQTLGYTSGDCDDLTALYCALLEAVGVPTAFITVPGHILPAFALSSSVGQDWSIVSDGQAWVPVEATLLDGPFDQACVAGARQWGEYDQDGAADLYQTSEAWSVFPPVGFGESGVRIGLPDRADLVAAVGQSLAVLVRREIAPRVAALEDDLASASSPESAVRIRNRLAVTYARYGLYDEAAEHLREIVSRHEHAAALVNLANIHLIRDDHARAAVLYDRALAQDPENKAALLGAAQCARDAGDTERARLAQERLEAVAPELASRSLNAGADAGNDARASRATDANAVVWEEAEP